MVALLQYYINFEGRIFAWLKGYAVTKTICIFKIISKSKQKNA